MKIKINKTKGSTIVVFLIWSMLFSIPVLSQRINNIILLSSELIITIWFLRKHKGRNLTKKYCVPIILLWICFILTTILNIGLDTRTLNAFVTGYKYVLFFYAIAFFVKYNKFESVLGEFYILSLIILILSDVAVLISKGKGIGGNDVLGNFFIGNKFAVSYLHMLFLSLFQLHRGKKNKFKLFHYFILVAYSIIICYLMECSTGIVGCLVMGLYTFLDWKKTKLSRILESPKVFLAVFFGATFLLVFSDVLLGNAYFTNLFMKYSHTSKILSGRLDMYEIALLHIQRSPWIGYGINCTIVEDILTWGNAQNGLLKLLLDHGIIGTVAFSIVAYNAFYSKKESDEYTHSKLAPFIALLYGLAICSMVEICLVGHFYLALAVVNAFNHLEVGNAVFRKIIKKA